MITKENKVKMLINEINDITEPKIREFAIKMVENADDYFFTVMASSSGKYHPDFAREVGGLVKHTRAVAFFAECVAESAMLSEHDKNLLTLAALAHDIKKQGNGVGKHTVLEHPILASNYLRELGAKYPNLISEEDLYKVCHAVERHMGKWCEKEGLPIPETEFDKYLQIADYIASRKEILGFNFRPTDEETVEEDPGDFVLDFGKYKGKGMTIREIHETELKDPKKATTYVEWMAGIPDFSMKEAQDKAKKFLESYKKEPPRVEEVKVSAAAIDDLPF